MLTGFPERRAGLSDKPEPFGPHFLLYGQVP